MQDDANQDDPEELLCPITKMERPLQPPLSRAAFVRNRLQNSFRTTPRCYRPPLCGSSGTLFLFQAGMAPAAPPVSYLPAFHAFNSHVPLVRAAGTLTSVRQSRRFGPARSAEGGTRSLTLSWSVPRPGCKYFFLGDTGT